LVPPFRQQGPITQRQRRNPERISFPLASPTAHSDSFLRQLAQFLLKIFRLKAFLPESLGFVQIFWKQVFSVEYSVRGIKDKLVVPGVVHSYPLLEPLDKPVKNFAGGVG
jgi:hypothetical protein